jgi:UDP-3-O-[3-hydroxymyristoyl] glucosamine N-acyltransferase
MVHEVGRKYVLTGETKTHAGYTLRRIRRLSDGQIGGWIERESNLSQAGSCWVADDAVVFERAYVTDHACARGRAVVGGRATLREWAEARDEAQLWGEAWLCDHACARGHAQIIGSASLYDWAAAEEEAVIGEHAALFDGVVVRGSSYVGGESRLRSRTL